MKPSPLFALSLACMLLLGACSPAVQTVQPSPTFRPAALTPYVPGPSPTPGPALPTPPPHPAPTAAAHPRPVMIDTDMAADDWMAILYLLQRTDVAVQAITVSGTGEAHCGPGIQNALGLVALAGRAPIPVACGRETPLTGSHVFPDSWRKGVDSLNGLSLPAGQNSSPGQTAVALLSSLLQGAPEPVTFLSTGPLTNLGDLLQGSPALKAKIAAIYIMGGAVHVPGNLGSSNTSAEWNIYVDPHAANLVFASGVPVTLVSLDATNHVPATPAFYARLKADHATPEATFIYDLFTRNRSYQSGRFYFWDPTSAVILSQESLATFEQDSLCVVEDEGPQVGQTKISAGCPSVRVAVNVDAAGLEQLFLATLNNP